MYIREENVIDEIMKLISDNLIEILENSINESKKVNKLTVRTKTLRPEYSINYERNRKCITQIIEKISNLRKNKILDEYNREYAKELERLAIFAVYNFMSYKLEKCERQTVKAWSTYIDSSIQKNGENGKSVNAAQVIVEIREALFYQYIKQENNFFSRFEYENKAEENIQYEDDKNIPYQVIKPYFDNEEIRCKIDELADHKHEVLNEYASRITMISCNEKLPRGVMHFMFSEYYKEDFSIFFDVCKIGVYTYCKGLERGYMWGVDNWCDIPVNHFTYEKMEQGESYDRECYNTENYAIKANWVDLYYKKDLIEKHIFSEKNMSQWLLISTLERLTADYLSFESNNSVGTGTNLFILDGIDDVINKRTINTIQKTNIFKVARVKGNIDKKDDNTDRDCWCIYSFQKACLDYMIGENFFKVLQIKKENSIYFTFSSMKNYFDNINVGINKFDLLFCNIYYLNQFVHFDVAVELCYGLEKLCGLSKKGGKELFDEIWEEIRKLAIVAVHLQEGIKCGVGEIIHDCIIRKIKEKETLEITTVEEYKRCLNEITELLGYYISDVDVEYMKKILYEEILKNSWFVKTPREIGGEEIKTNQELKEEKKSVEPKVGVTFDQNLFADIEVLKRRNVLDKNGTNKISKVIYEGNIKKILAELSKNMQMEMTIQLGISEEAWSWAKENLSNVSKQSKWYAIYNKIQKVLLQENYDE